MSTELEKKSLEAHVDLCQQRYLALEHRLERLEQRFEKMEHTLTEIKDAIHQAHKAEISQLLGIAGTIIAVLLGVVGFLFNRGVV